MIKKLTLLFLIIGSAVFAQDAETPPEKPIFRFAPQSRVFFIKSANFGDNQLADAYGGNFGIGTSLSFFSIYGIRPTVNYDYSQYRLVKPETVGNVNSSASYWSISGVLAYPMPIDEKINISPDLGMGYAQLRLQPGGDKYGKQSGVQFRLGFTADYKIGKSTAVFAGIQYINTSFDVNTHPDFKKYFDHASQLQFAVGLQFGKG